MRYNWFIRGNFWLLVTLIGAGGLGCGYRIAAHNRLDGSIQTIAVRPLRNNTSTMEAEQILTRALVRELVQSGTFKVVDEGAGPDALFVGEITQLTANPITFGRASFGSTFLVTVHLRLSLIERKTGRALMENENHIFREQYVINADVENFFSELNPALERISRDFAGSVVTRIREDF